MSKMRIGNHSVDVQRLQAYIDYDAAVYHPISLQATEDDYSYPTPIATSIDGLLNIVKQLDRRVDELEEKLLTPTVAAEGKERG